MVLLILLQEGKRGIEPGNPARSLLFHALASPNVISGVDDEELDAFPTLAEIETIENYVYGIQPPSIEELKIRSKDVASWISGHNLQQGPPMAIVVFASEYRPAPETVHKKHADMCFSRAGVARVGTDEPFYDDRRRGFQRKLTIRLMHFEFCQLYIQHTLQSNLKVKKMYLDRCDLIPQKTKKANSGCLFINFSMEMNVYVTLIYILLCRHFI